MRPALQLQGEGKIMDAEEISERHIESHGMAVERRKGERGHYEGRDVGEMFWKHKHTNMPMRAG